MSGTDISASIVMELRRETGAGMMDCKKALQESGGDKSIALDYLRKKGIAAAAKRADRSADQGIVVCKISEDGQSASLVEINSETDFVAKNEMFRRYGEDLANLLLSKPDLAGKTVPELKEQVFPSGQKVGDILTDMIGKIGEKLDIGNFARMHIPNGFIGSYIHSDSRLGVLVGLEGASLKVPETISLGRDLAMQIAASAPTVVRREEIPQEKIESEKAIEIERARNEGKPEAAVTKIAEGRVNKWFSEVVLLEQPFVKDPKVIIKDLVAEVARKTGQMIQVQSFIRYRVGS